MNLYSPVISGSLTVTGSTSFIGNVTMTGTVSATASNAELLSGTGSVGFTTTGSFTTMSGSVSSRVSQIETVYATTGSNSFRATQSITGSLTVTGQITAQTLNVQQVTSSIVYSSGSNVFGCDINSRQTFTGSFYQSGSNMNINAGCIIIGNTASPASDFYFNVTTVCAGTNATVAQFYNAEYTSGTRGFIRIRNSANIGATTSAYIGQGQDQKTYIYNNDPSRAGDIVISASGLVGMNTCAPIAQLHVKTSVASGNRPTNLATSATNSAVYFTTIDGSSAGIAFGQLGANTNYIQATYENGSSSTPLSLNPYGGNVGIGTGNTAPGGALDVITCSNSTQNFYLRNTDNTNASSRAYFNVVAGNTSLSLLALAGGSSCGGTYIAGTCGADMYFQQQAGGSVNMIIKCNGSVGIGGITSPTAQLHVCSAYSQTPLLVQGGGNGNVPIACFMSGPNQIAIIDDNANLIIGGCSFSTRGTTSTSGLLVSGKVGMGNSSPLHNLDIGSVRTNSGPGSGGFAFCNMVTAQGVFSTFACVGSDANVITTITYTNTNDHNRSGVFVARWAYNSGCASLFIVSCLWNDSQNIATLAFRNHQSGALQICVSGGGGDYRVQALTQGTKAT